MKTLKLAFLFSVFNLCIACSSFPIGTKSRVVNFSDTQKELEGTLYLPKTGKPTAAVIVVHGGGWSARTGEMTTICKKLVKRNIAAFNITYRLAPEHLYPSAILDVKDAINWLTKNAQNFNIDPNRIGGWGYSAGANLILMAGLNPSMGLKAIVSGGTPAKLDYWPNSPIITEYIGQPMSTHEKQWREASPIYIVQKNSPPVFLYHGQKDNLVEVEQMYLMEEALKEKTVAVKTHEVSMLGHITTYLFSFESEKLGVDFLKERL